MTGAWVAATGVLMSTRIERNWQIREAATRDLPNPAANLYFDRVISIFSGVSVLLSFKGDFRKSTDPAVIEDTV